ncbi:unnamed protein product [Rangifer tarandus platyrhynchus]|uniref:Uncharacterized protein n=2 Tax=Rangifer tarandus platyrhynchus TaxID=3082113 RepID=A0AC59YLN4_RANTA|nr:unnamed protein product [Rangifer tarandus platyrhynchus]
MQQGLRLSVKATLSFDTCVLSQEGICPFERESVGWSSQGVCASLVPGERRFWNSGERNARSQLTLSPRSPQADLRRLSSFSSQVRSPLGKSCSTPGSPPHAHQPLDGHSLSFPSPKSLCHPLHIF